MEEEGEEEPYMACMLGSCSMVVAMFISAGLLRKLERSMPPGPAGEVEGKSGVV